MCIKLYALQLKNYAIKLNAVLYSNLTTVAC